MDAWHWMRIGGLVIPVHVVPFRILPAKLWVILWGFVCPFGPKPGIFFSGHISWLPIYSYETMKQTPFLVTVRRCISWHSIHWRNDHPSNSPHKESLPISILNLAMPGESEGTPLRQSHQQWKCGDIRAIIRARLPHLNMDSTCIFSPSSYRDGCGGLTLNAV